MSTTIRAIKIDPKTRELTEIEIPIASNGRASLRDLYGIIGCRLIDIVSLDKKNNVIVDDEALLSEEAPIDFWQWGKDFQPIAGVGLIVGSGASISKSATVSIEDAKKIVRFTKRKFNGIRYTKSDDGSVITGTLDAPECEWF